MHPRVSKGNVVKDQTTVGASGSFGPAGAGQKTFQATLTGTGAVTASVSIQVSNDQIEWLDLASMSLSGTTSVSDGFATEAPWAYYRSNLTAISGTNDTLNVTGTGG